MKVLAFDSSSTALAVAILEDERLLAETCLNIKKNHSISLMPVIDFLMQQVGWQPNDLERIVVAQGPGSYTGLRVAVATAKVLADSLAIDLVGISSLQTLLPTDDQGLVIPLMDARRNNVYAGFYENGRALKPGGHQSLEAVLTQVQHLAVEQVTFVGEVANFSQQILEHLPQARIKESLPSAYQLGLLGQKAAAQAIDSFVPAYLKKVEAEENWLKDHAETGQDYIKRV